METIDFVKKETSLIVLPDEVKELALKVPELKQKEVQTVLTQIFSGTADWKKQADSIVVKDINDKMSIQLADTGRKNVKNARLAAEKIFDSKREEVQQKKSEFDLEDKLWLKAKQTAQILFKDIESTFEWKAKFAERYEAEQKELITQLRIEKVSKFTNDINRIALENMSDQIFDIFLSGIEKAFNDKLETERKAEDDRIAKEKAEAEARELQRLENIRLKEEAIEKERLAEIERKKNAAVLKAQQEKADKERAELLAKAETERKEKERLAEIERKKNAAVLKAQQEKADKERAELLAKAETERKEKERLEKEIADKKSADEKLKKDAELKLQAEQKAKAAEEKKAKLAPDKNKLLAFGQALNDVPRPEIKSIEAAVVMAQINGLLVKLNNYIITEANKL